ncbi:glycoside hydrolase family 31 protein [Rhodomicrobium vannielii ATCC 17100]|uniref:glycoside hydrolase family 31 protein n=1 Tax=Rhodomicrobium vannielii TaxID=1069 RepID=UPI0019195BFC|nr:TIM-barrel domain-containing protein [Rhodomicrobium vannielii]MBJ7535003.1 glycoside hydrolase family 31 protein [Rhodomicrobium vannielii ATCC 17100]
MRALTGGTLLSATGNRVEIELERGYRLTLSFHGARTARLLVTRPHGLRCPRTWSLSPELSGDDAIDGRDRADETGLPIEPIRVTDETPRAITIETALMRAEIRRVPLGLTWSSREHEDEPFRVALTDRQTQSYLFDERGNRFAHYLASDPATAYYGFGEKTGDANKRGRRLRMKTSDAMGYDAETSDPLYKHIPFFIALRPDASAPAIGLFYDNLSHAAFDMGQEIDAYHGPFTSFEAEDGDLDLWLFFGGSARDITPAFTALTGRTAMPPRWSLSYSGSTMHYTEAPDAELQLTGFLAQIHEHGLPCGSFHLSSGYTKRGDGRYVFTWDRTRFPDPARVAAAFNASGVRLIANVKPAMLTDHPRFAEVERFGGFVREAEGEHPHLAQFWSGNAAYLDFTNPETSAWWTAQVKAQLLDHGIAATWNDNNEFEVWDGEARADVNWRGGTMACLRPVQTNLMLRASERAQREHAPRKRPFLVSRSGGPGLQRYAQTWTGDNATSWKTLRYNLRMGHGLSLSGVYNFGHDVGGFAGPRPDPELFMRWIEQGVFWPRFSIHSWNDDGSVNEPWMYTELLPLVREAFQLRERLVPLLYTLLWRAHAHHEPILRPLFYDFPSEAEAYGEHDAFMLGADMLVAPVVEDGARERRVWLPDTPGGWYALHGGAHFEPGRHSVDAPLGRAPAFVRAGAVLPFGPSPSWQNGPLTLRIFPGGDGQASLSIFDDDGESVFDLSSPPCILAVASEWRAKSLALRIERAGSHAPRWPHICFEDETGQSIPIAVNGLQDVRRLQTSELPFKAPL